MPVFNDYSHYYGAHSSSPSNSTPASNFTSYSNPFSYAPSPYSTRAVLGHTNYFPATSNLQSSKLLSTIGSSGLTGRYYGNSPTKNTNYGYNYKTRDKYDLKTNTFSPSPYTTYTMWKENQITSKWRNENYRYNRGYKETPSRTAKPLFIDTAKIDVNTPRTKKPVYEKTSALANENVEKPMTRDDQVGTIKRGRTVVRMHTKMLKENPYLKKNEKKEPEPDTEEKIEPSFNRMSPIRISRLKKRSILQYNRHDSGNKHWLSSSDSSDSDSEGSIKRENTIKKKFSRSGTLKRDETLKRKDMKESEVNKTLPKSQSKDALNKVNRRLSIEMFEEQTAILDSMIKEELARKDAVDYFSDPKRGTVKIKKAKNDVSSQPKGHSTDSNTDDEDTKKKSKRLSKKGRQKTEIASESDTPSEKSTPSSSRRNSLFQDLIIGETINENFIEDLENKIQNNYTNPEKVLTDKVPKLKIGSVKITQKLVKKPSRFDTQKSPSEASIVEVEENRPKTPKFFIQDVQIESNKFTFDKEEIKKQEENILREQDVTEKPKENTKTVQKLLDSTSKPIKSKSPAKDIKKVVNTNKEIEKPCVTATLPATTPAKIPDMKVISISTTASATPAGKDLTPPLGNESKVNKALQKSKEEVFSLPEKIKEDKKVSEMKKDVIKISEVKKDFPQEEINEACEEKGHSNKTSDNKLQDKISSPSPLKKLTQATEKLSNSSQQPQLPTVVFSKKLTPLPKANEQTQEGKDKPPKENLALPESMLKGNLQANSEHEMIKSLDQKAIIDRSKNKKGDKKISPPKEMTNILLIEEKSPVPDINKKIELPKMIKEAPSTEMKINVVENKDAVKKDEINSETSLPKEKTNEIILINEKTTVPVINKKAEEKKSSPIKSPEMTKKMEVKNKENSAPGKKEVNKCEATISPKENDKSVPLKKVEPKQSSPISKSPGTSPKMGIKSKEITNLKEEKATAKKEDLKSEIQAEQKINVEIKSKNESVKTTEDQPVKPSTKKKLVKSKPTLPTTESTSQKKISLKKEEKEVEMPVPEINGEVVVKTSKKYTHKKTKKDQGRKMSAIMHMKPRAMAIRTVINPLPSLKTPRLAPLPQPSKATIAVIPPIPDEESSSSEEESDSEESSTATEGSSEESDSDSSSSDSKQGKQRMSTTSLDSGFGSACYKKRVLRFRIR